MTSRIFAASIVVLGIGAASLLVETSAGSAPLVAASALVRPGAPPPVAAPSFAHRFVPRGIGAFSRMDGFHRGSRFGDGRGQAVPLWWGYASTFPGYYPPYAAPEYLPPYGDLPYASPPYVNFSERSRPVVAHAPECRTDSQTVPSESGGERTIHITRCN
jgi:hypothetical protein